MPSPKFSLYLSHSWRPGDVDLNLHVWGQISPACNLLVDENVGATPPYFINRIEEYIRRSDLFFAVLTLREEDLELPRCSKASLFEVRLAERARKPRFVMYERGCGFKPPEDKSDLVRYEVFDRADLEFESSSTDQALREWLNAVQASLRPRRLMFHEASLALLPGSASDLMPVLEQALLEGGYTRTRALEPAATDFEVVNKLATTGLLVADVTATESSDALAMAHAVFLPTIRVAPRAAGGQAPALPWFLRGHPAMGYEEDIVYYDRADDLLEPVRQRARAMRDTRIPIENEAVGRRFFERRRWRPQHRVFVSHALKEPGYELIRTLLSKLQTSAVDAWEYKFSGKSGRRWKAQLKEELAGATHAVIVVDAAFDQSDICCNEVEFLAAKGRKVELLPFLVAGCSSRSARLRELHHESLPADATQAADRILAKLLDSLHA